MFNFLFLLLVPGSWTVLDVHSDIILASYSSPNSPPKLVSYGSRGFDSSTLHLWQATWSLREKQLLYYKQVNLGPNIFPCWCSDVRCLWLVPCCLDTIKFSRTSIEQSETLVDLCLSMDFLGWNLSWDREAVVVQLRILILIQRSPKKH